MNTAVKDELQSSPNQSDAGSRLHYLDMLKYVGLHLACFGVIWTGVSWRDIVLCAVLYLTRMFGLMAGYHRYFAHRSFKTSRPVQFLLALLGTLGVQKGVLWWASTHRHHHRYSDTAHDLHSPLQESFLYSHSGWFLDIRNRDTDRSRVQDLVRFPELVWLDKWTLVPIGFFAFLIWLGFGWSGLVWGFCISTVLIWHAIHSIGSFGHRWGGYRRFPTLDNSRNKWFLAILLLGDGWHNNHHFYPSSARAGFTWWEIDIVYWILKIMNKLGIVWDLKEPSQEVRLGNSQSAKTNVRRFEGWLLGLRHKLGDSLDRAERAVPHVHGPSWLKVRQRIEILLDDFSGDAVEQISIDPEQLQETLNYLRRDIRELLESSLHDRHGPEHSITESIDSELVAHVQSSSFSHLLAREGAFGNVRA